jgi:type II secretory pathway pseudopilin PulG
MRVKTRDENGFTMIMTVIGVTMVALVAAVAVTTVSGSAQQTGRSDNGQQAYEAALAGIHEYAYHLQKYPDYWAECLNAVKPGEKYDALNEMGSTANTRPVPGGGGATYALEIIPATGQSECVPMTPGAPSTFEAASTSMLESLGSSRGTFRIRATGFYGDSESKVMATFKPKSFLDYVYFTQLETSDPVTYGNPELIAAANRQCSKTIYEGRYTTPLENAAGKYLNEAGQVTSSSSSAKYCDTISFIGQDNIKGPMHTNDAFVICEKPTLGREPRDPIEVSYPKEPGWFSTSEIPHSGSSCSGGKQNFKGTYEVGSSVLIPPPTNSKLSEAAESKFVFTGEIKICLEGATMKVGRGMSCTQSPVYSGPLPGNGIIYDANGSGCSTEYSPFNVTYSPGTVGTCGNINIEGTFSKPLTIAAANNVMAMNNVTRTNEEAMLGLIANNFIRVYHPVELVHPKTLCTTERVNGHNTENCVENPEVTECKGNATGSVTNLKIEAALLAINHSFIVDNYKCGAQLGTLNVKGAIAQKYRGAVGTTGNTGYVKNYEYDDRFRTTEPPQFTAPVESDWVIGREIVE